MRLYCLFCRARFSDSNMLYNHLVQVHKRSTVRATNILNDYDCTEPIPKPRCAQGSDKALPLSV